MSTHFARDWFLVSWYPKNVDSVEVVGRNFKSQPKCTSACFYKCTNDLQKFATLKITSNRFICRMFLLGFVRLNKFQAVVKKLFWADGLSSKS